MSVTPVFVVDMALVSYGMMRHNLTFDEALRVAKRVTASLWGEIIPGTDRMTELFDEALGQ